MPTMLCGGTMLLWTHPWRCAGREWMRLEFLLFVWRQNFIEADNIEIQMLDFQATQQKNLEVHALPSVSVVARG